MSPKHQGGSSSVRWSEINGEVAYKLLEFNVPNDDGLVIQRHEISSRKEVVCVLGEPEDPYNIKHTEIAGTARTMFMPDGLYLFIKYWPGSHGDLLRQALQVGVDILPVGTGCVDEKNYVWDYRLLYIYPNTKDHGRQERNPI